jgi:RNA polymerase sigma-70 factor (ECF subfamily)
MGRKKDAQFDSVMRENLAAVSAYARSATSRSYIAEEAVQETFIRAWRYWPTFRNESSVLSWLITICRRVIIDLVQKDSVVEELPAEIADNHDVYEQSAIQELISHLPLAQREVVVLCAVLGFDYETAATTLSIPVGTVRSRLARARESLGKELEIARAV